LYVCYLKHIDSETLFRLRIAFAPRIFLLFNLALRFDFEHSLLGSTSHALLKGVALANAHY
jgi:hypothetical protein